jgi:hypothetical protein
MVESRQEEVLSIIAVFTVFAFLFVVVRVYSRYLGRNFGWDDHLIVAAMVIMLAQTICTWECKALTLPYLLKGKTNSQLDILRSGTGFHVWDIPKKSISYQVVTNQWNFAVQMMYHPLMFLIRASIIIFLWRMKDNRKRIRYSLHIVCP